MDLFFGDTPLEGWEEIVNRKIPWADDQFGGLLVACRQRQAGNFSHLSSPSVEEAGSLPPNWYWWRSQFSCLASNEFKLRVSIIFDFATSTQIGQEAFHERNLYNYMGAFRF